MCETLNWLKLKKKQETKAQKLQPPLTLTQTEIKAPYTIYSLVETPSGRVTKINSHQFSIIHTSTIWNKHIIKKYNVSKEKFKFLWILNQYNSVDMWDLPQEIIKTSNTARLVHEMFGSTNNINLAVTGRPTSMLLWEPRLKGCFQRCWNHGMHEVMKWTKQKIFYSTHEAVGRCYNQLKRIKLKIDTWILI